MLQRRSEELYALLARVHEAMLPRLMESALPVRAERGGNLVQCGTGILFRVADKSFLVTARHVAEIELREGFSLFMARNADDPSPIRIAGRFVCGLGAEDVAVVELNDAVVKSLGSRRFLGFHDVEAVAYLAPEGWYYVFGYPSCWAEPKQIQERYLVYASVLYRGPTDSWDDFDTNNHIVFEMYGKECNRRFDGEAAEHPQSLAGISGSGIWCTHITPNDAGSWCVDRARIVGIQTGVYKPIRYVRRGIDQEVTPIKGIRWRVVQSLLRNQYPELEPAFGIIRPP